jgi:hypothetical protein
LTLLTNNLTQAQLLAIWQKPEYNSYIAIEYVNVQDSFPENFQIDPNLFNAYDSGQISHDKTRTNYPPNTTGQYLNETRGIADATKNGLVSSATLPTKILDFAASKMLPSDCTFTRASVASYVDKYGTIKYAGVNQPRFTHDPLTLQSLGILIEESRTNYHVNSVNVSISSAITKTLSQVAPDGTSTATLIFKNSISNGKFDPDSIGTIANGFYVRSLFVKPNNNTSSIITFESIGGTTGAGGSISFNALTKVFVGDTTIPTSYGYQDYPNGWIRVWVCVEKTDTKFIGSGFYLGGYGGTSAPDNSTFVWGFQFEEGKCVTSYIPTTVSSYMRINEVLAINNSVVPKREGTFVLTGVMPNTWERQQGGYRKTLVFGGSELIGYIPNGDITSYDGIAPMGLGSTTLNDSFALAYNSVNRRASVNGSTIYASNSWNPNTLANQCYLGSSNGQGSINGTIKRLTIYSKMLGDTELISLSTKGRVSGFESGSQAANSGLGEAAFLDVKSLMFAKSRQEFSIDGSGASITRNIRRPYDFYFELVDTTGYTVLTSQPPAMPTLCSANTDYPLTVTLPVGKTLTYCVYPVVY